jgi:hypothetical protein
MKDFYKNCEAEDKYTFTRSSIIGKRACWGKLFLVRPQNKLRGLL